ncbi:MAG: hypothetical protein JXA25_15540 [Anaerolineales bacterium]|nr:hypothetical protein [Anaerolineales bacterium]
MKLSRRWIIILTASPVVLVTVIIFRAIILNNKIKPAALVIWILLRTFILSIDPQYFWIAAIIAAGIILIRLLPHELATIQSESYIAANATIRNIELWRNQFAFDKQGMHGVNAAKQNLQHLLVSFYALKLNISNQYHVFRALEQGDIPIPEDIHAYLFTPELGKPGKTLAEKFHTIREVVQKRIRLWTGQEKARHYHMINEIINFMESQLEAGNDNG